MRAGRRSAVTGAGTMRAMGRLARMRRGRRRDAGLSLFGVLLGLAVFAVLVAGVMEWFGDRAREETDRLAAAQLAALSEAVGAWVASDFPARLAAAPQTVPLATIRAAGALPPGFAPDGIDALGREFRVLMASGGTGALDVLVTHAVPAGDERLPVSALRAVGGEARLGVVHPVANVTEVPRLVGPAVSVEIAGFRTAFSGHPNAYALGILSRYDRQSVFGDFLYRVAVPGLAGANTMETALDLGGNDVEDAGEIRSETMVLDRHLEVGGDLDVVADLLVGGDAEVAGTIAAGGQVSARTAAIAGTVTARDAAVTRAVTAATVTATGQVRGGSIGTAGALSAGSGDVTGALFAGAVSAREVTANCAGSAPPGCGRARVSSIRAGSVNAPTLTVTGAATVSGAVTAGSVRATNRLTAQDAGFTTLVVGSCSGC